MRATISLKRRLVRNDSGVWGDDPTGDGDTVVLRSTDIDLDGSWSGGDPALRQLTPGERQAALLQEGDVLVVKSSGSASHLGKSALVGQSIADVSACFSNFVQRLRVDAHVEPRFLWYFLNSTSASAQIDQLSNTTTGLRNISGEILGQLRLPALAATTQRTIADYLDRAIAPIDALILAKRRMVERLEEHESTWGYAVLTTQRAESGSVPLKSVARWVEGPGIMTVDFRDEGVPLLRIRNLVGDTIDLTGCGYVPASLAVARWNHLRVRAGELLVSGSARSGTPVVVPPEADGAIPYTGLIRMWPVSRRLERDYLRLFLASLMFDDQIDRLKTGVGLQHWGPYHLAQIRIPLPPVDAQRMAAAEFFRRERRRRRLTKQHTEQTDLLQERRQALITAAVSGQLHIPEAA